MPRAVKSKPIVIEQDCEYMKIRIEIEPHEESWPVAVGDEPLRAMVRSKVASPLKRNLRDAHADAWRGLWSRILAYTSELPGVPSEGGAQPVPIWTAMHDIADAAANAPRKVPNQRHGLAR